MRRELLWNFINKHDITLVYDGKKNRKQGVACV